MLRILTAVVAASAAHGLELTKENWAEKTAGKTVFIKALAPW